MEKNNLEDKNADRRLRELFAESKITAGENLKYRIMQQVQTESMLMQLYRKKEKQTNRQIGGLLTIAGVAYALIMAVVAFGYLQFGMEVMMQPQIYLGVAFIVVVAGLFGFIGFYDERLRAKFQKSDKD